MRELMEAMSGKNVEDLYKEMMRIGKKLVSSFGNAVWRYRLMKTLEIGSL